MPTLLFGTLPSTCAFFTIFSMMQFTHTSQQQQDFLTASHSSANIMTASLVAGIPASIISVPSDVIKKRLFLTQSSNTWFYTSKSILQQDSWRGLFVGWRVNLYRDLPFSVIRMLLYENFSYCYLKHIEPQLSGSHRRKHQTQKEVMLKEEIENEILAEDMVTSDQQHDVISNLSKRSLSKHLTPNEAAGIGMLSGVCTAFLTQPLDCTNTRIKSGEVSNIGVMRALSEIIKRDGAYALFRGFGPRAVIVGAGSTMFWYFYAKIRKEWAGISHL
jgi:hypothetical protein